MPRSFTTQSRPSYTLLLKELLREEEKPLVAWIPLFGDRQETGDAPITVPSLLSCRRLLRHQSLIRKELKFKTDIKHNMRKWYVLE